MRYTINELNENVIPDLYDKIVFDMELEFGDNWKVNKRISKSKIKNKLMIICHEVIDDFCNCNVWDAENVNPEEDRNNVFDYIMSEINKKFAE